MTRFSIVFALIATLNACATTQTPAEKKAADYAQLISEEVPDSATFKRQAPSEPNLVVSTTRRVQKRPQKVVAKATPTTRAWVAGQGSTDPDDQPIIGKPGEIIEISFE